MITPNVLHWKEKWLAHLQGERRLSPKTLEAYDRDVTAFLHFLTQYQAEPCTLSHLCDLLPMEVRAFLAARKQEGCSPATTGRALSSLRSFMRYLERNNQAKEAPVRALRMPRKPDRLPRPVSQNQAERLLNDVDLKDQLPWLAARDKALFSLLYGAGLRIAEALSLKVADLPVQGQKVMAITGKGNKQRLVPLLPAIITALRAYHSCCPFSLAGDDLLFRGQKGGPLNQRVVRKAVQDYRHLLGLDDKATPHALRHAFASHILNAGGDIRTIQEALGHASLSTTQNYTRLETHTLKTLFEATHPRA
jgi:integrase/recombinase XerC